MAAAIDEIDTDAVRCLILQGAGRAFSAGGDFERMQQLIDEGTPVTDHVRELEMTTNELIVSLVRYPVSTIAKIDGPTIGAGANLAIACDVQLASDRTRIGFVFRNFGLSGDSGSSYFLPRLVGENVAKELFLTGEIVDPDRALDLGLVNHVYPFDSFDEQVDVFVERITTGPNDALSHAKRLVGDGLGKSLEEILRDEMAVQGIAFSTDDHADGVAALPNDRDTVYEGH